MDRKTSLSVLAAVRAERQKRAGHPFADAVQEMANRRLKSEAVADVGNLALAGLGAGAAARGAAGLYNVLKRALGTPRPTGGPALLPLPYPVDPAADPRRQRRPRDADAAADPAALPKAAGFLAGDAASTKGGIPWYGPAMFFGGLAGVGAGWKGLDALLNSRRRAASGAELERRRREFHDALLAQYDKPLGGPPDKAASAAAPEMEKVGQALDALYDDFRAALATRQKLALDLPNVGGAAAGLYGTYAGLTGLLSGAMVYDKIQKRSRRAVIQKALQRRDRRRFTQQPTEIFAVPEPVAHTPQPAFRDEMRLLEEPTRE